MRVSLWVLISLTLAVGCAAPEVEQVPESAAATEPELSDEEWTEALLEHRREIDEEFRTSKDSPMAGIQYLKSEPGDEVYLALEDGTFGLVESAVPAAVVGVTKNDGTWSWQKLGQDVVCRVDEEEVSSGVALEGAVAFAIDRFHLSFYPSEDRVTFIVFDPERPEMQTFEHLLYFPPDRDYAVEARLELISEPEKLEMPTTRNLVKTFYRYAKVHFEVDGEKQELTALKSALEGDGSEGLFIPFKDTTTGRETYGAGRYLMIDEPGSEEFELDFNRTFNPLCNYSLAYNCTLPPRENHLKVAIRAGEKTYPH